MSFSLPNSYIDLVHQPNPLHMMGLLSVYADGYGKDSRLIEIYQGDRKTVNLSMESGK